MIKQTASIGLALCLFSISACVSGPGETYSQFHLDNGESITTGASRRIVLNTKTHPSSRPGRVNPERIVCAEPSPDVAIAIANSFNLGASFLSDRANAAVTGTQTQALASLAERTVTVQLLRDQMYRACEAYANGAISGTEYSLLMSRNNDAMVTLMLGESASRLVGRNLANISSTAEGEANTTVPVSAIEAATRNLVEATQKVEDATKEASEAEAVSEKADEALMALQEGEATEAAEAEAEENSEETDASEAQAQQMLADAEEEQAEAVEALRLAVSGQSTATASGGTVGASFGNLNQYSVEVAKSLSTMQQSFLEVGAEEHFISACVVELGGTSFPIDATKSNLIYASNVAGGFDAEKVAEEYKMLTDAGVSDQQARVILGLPNSWKGRKGKYDGEQGGHLYDGDEFVTHLFKSPTTRTHEETLFADQIERAVDSINRAFIPYLEGSGEAPTLQEQISFLGNVSTLMTLLSNIEYTNKGAVVENYREKLLASTIDLADFIEDSITLKKTDKQLRKTMTRVEHLFDVYEEFREALIFGAPERQAIARYNRIAEREAIRSRWISQDRKERLSDKHLRTMVALENRGRASLLAEHCIKHLDRLLEREHSASVLDQFSDFYIELEKAKAKVGDGPDDEDQANKTPAPNKRPVIEVLEEYIRCDANTKPYDTEICRAKLIHEIGAGITVQVVDAPAQLSGAPAPTSTHQIQLASYTSKASAEAGWAKIKSSFSAAKHDSALALVSPIYLKYSVTAAGKTTELYALRLAPFSEESAKAWLSAPKTIEVLASVGIEQNTDASKDTFAKVVPVPQA
ncbi:MAG: hypothetical protein AAGL97_09800 [Pseudomonadota bacterium]